MTSDGPAFDDAAIAAQTVIEGRNLPRMETWSRPYWEATGRGELLLQHCAHCGEWQFYPRPLCTTCGEVPEWELASGRGEVHTFTVIRQNRSAPFKELGPYVVAMIQLDEGPRMMTNLVGCAIDDVRIGLPVQVHFVPADDEMALPFWRPVVGVG